MGCGACLPCLLRPGGGSEGSCLDPASQSSPPRCLPHRPPAAASGKAGLWPADPRRRGPFSFLGAGVLWVPGWRGKDGDSGEARPPLLRCHLDSASLGDACVALGLLDRCLTDAQMLRNLGRVILHPLLPGTPPALVNSATICSVNSARNSARAAGAMLASQLISASPASLVEAVPSSPSPLRLASPSTQRWPLTGAPCGSAGKESACNAGDVDSTLGLGRSPGEGNSYPFQYSGLEKWTIQSTG